MGTAAKQWSCRGLPADRDHGRGYVMDPQDAINLTQQAMLTALLLGAPVLLAGVLVGLLIGLAQALTQIQDQTVAFVPKIVAMVAVLILCLPWLVQKLVEYSEELIANIPKTIAG